MILLKSPIAIENRSYISDYDIGSGNITLYSSTQIPGVIRDALSKILGIAGNKINVKAPDVGGGFGGKGSLYPEEIIVTYLSKKLKKPIKWTSDRLEDFLTTSQAFEEIIEAKLFFDDEGKFIALELFNNKYTIHQFRKLQICKILSRLRQEKVL